MTKIYFIRHAEADNAVRNGRIRPLTEKGVADRKLVIEFLQDKKIDVVLSSPFKRAVDTIADFADKYEFEIKTIEDFREQKSSSSFHREGIYSDPVFRKQMINKFLEQQWTELCQKGQKDSKKSEDDDGETLFEVQKRNIHALSEVLALYQDKNIVIGTHGTALSTIINYYDNTYGYEDFMEMVNILPWVVRMDFDKNNLIRIEKIDLFMI